MKKEPGLPPLVGRSKEVEAIDAALSALGDGRGQLFMLAGEAGIGKSTLAKYTSELALQKGAAVYWGFSWEAGGAPAYWPWTQLLRSLVHERDLSDEEKASLALLLPEFADAARSDGALQPDQARFQLFDSIRMVLSRIAQQAPLVLVFEDLHAADKDTLNLLRYIARHVSACPILIIATYREVEARTSGEAEPLWQMGRDAIVMKLSRLNPDQIAEFLSSKTGSRPSSSDVGKWFDTTSGNPLFLSELVGLLGRYGPPEGPGEKLPDTVEQVIGQQIDRLPGPAAALLSQASVLGKTFSLEALQTPSGLDRGEIERLLDHALAAEIIVPVASGEYEFSHGLYRDVLYSALPREDRSLLHLRHAMVLKERIEKGDQDGWSELAAHLAAAGTDHRTEAIQAWRHAADRAKARLAFDEAAALLKTAVDTFGQGPRFEPEMRCSLLLACAEAMLLAGDIEGGHARCLQAFKIARALEDPELSSAAALTYGTAIVVASVDPELINMLDYCLETLPKSDVHVRARVLARLAAALQPANDPTGPMEMAREAIEQARASGDKAVLYHVLRSAISALMDFAPPSERIALNKEFLALATEAKDVPSQFRSHLRLMIDASELADRAAFDSAIDACERIAERIGLPHYLWRVSSARAMQAIIEGRYSDASACLDHAQAMADQIDDVEPMITLPVQRFAVMHDWDSERATTLQAIQEQLDEAYASGLGEAKAFVQPFVAAFTVTEAEEARKLIENPRFIRRIFAGSDRFSMVAAGMLALKANDRQLAQKTFDSLMDFKQMCAVTGLMGCVWCGPVAFELGRLALALNRTDEAGEFLELALEIAERMRARPFVARIQFAHSLLAAQTGDTEAEKRLAQSALDLVAALEMRPIPGLSPQPQTDDAGAGTPGADFTIVSRGEVWEVAMNGEKALVKNSKGLEMLVRLLSQPDTDIHVLELAGPGTGKAVADGDAGPALDPQARSAYKRRVKDIRDELEEAQALDDISRVDGLREELDFITRELSRAFGLGGRERPQGKAAERARVNVQRRIKDAIERIEEQLPDAGRYLNNTIKTGSYCRYAPM